MNLERRYPKKRVIITGAGSGLGKALALIFAQNQWNVIIADSDKNRAFDTAQVVEKYSGKAFSIQCDVTNEKDCILMCTYIVKTFDGCDILINNAGVAAAGFYEKIPIQTWDCIHAINTKSIILMCRTFIPVFKQQRYGYIVNIASSPRKASLPEIGCYNMTKAVVISLSETLYGELSPYNIHVSVLCSTFFKINLMDQFISPDTRQKNIEQKFFDHSLATAEDVATHIIKPISKKRFFIIKQIDGKIIWWFKRHFPELYFKGLSFFIQSISLISLKT